VATKQKRGIAVAGNILTDLVKTISGYPEKGMQTDILSVSQAVGGCVPNTGIDLKRIDPSLPVYALGRVGDDDYGKWLLKQMRENGLDTDGVVIDFVHPTSFSDIMSVPSGERTIFCAKGAGAHFYPGDVNLDDVTAKASMLHIGYIMLQDAFDARDAEYGTVMARFLYDAQAHGIKTSVDAVSNVCADYREVMLPALRYCDNVIINEIECCGIWGLAPYRADGSLDVDNVRTAMEKTAACGVRERVVVHCKPAGFCLDVSTGRFTVMPSLKIPPEEIRGSVGAGDAFCAGTLYGIYQGLDSEELLAFASATAACNLFASDAIGSMKSADYIRTLPQKYGRVVLPE